MPRASFTAALTAIWLWLTGLWRKRGESIGARGDDHDLLLADAHLMANYAARIGRLQSKDAIETIERCEKAVEAGASRSSVKPDLIETINLLAKNIAPVTLLDLGSKWRPFPHRLYDAVIRPVFAGAAVLLIIVVGDLTLIYTHAQNVSAALTDIQTQDFPSKSEHLYQHWLTEKGAIAVAKGDAPPEAADFFKEYDDLRSLQASLNDNTSVVDTIGAQSRMDPVIFFFRNSISDFLKHPIETVKGKASSGEIGPDAFIAAQSNLDTYSDKIPDNLATAPAAPTIEGTRTGLKSWLVYYNQMVLDLSQLGITLSLPQDPYSVQNQISQKIRDCNDIISFYGGWVLPAFYGLLGAMVFHLRGIMNPLVPTPHLGSVAVRMTLAMMAGVSISWLLASPFAKPLGVHGPALGVFGLAFMFGFSIDIFFSALDRIVVTVTRSVAARPA